MGQTHFCGRLNLDDSGEQRVSARRFDPVLSEPAADKPAIGAPAITRRCSRSWRPDTNGATSWWQVAFSGIH